ncbi:flagellar basal-body rod protein FlgG [Rhodoplanes serenus]|jgi:flagellar basal-body rod protein FlgG|uniref:Flagellar basal-body rod protein FlgG n=1 Tax=Rhodoplanes serenus TaxID=200615 RepID=A0A327KC23_9BRAD|nr:flagellar basal-body rod protein FlgG [Rhodoplanes serenus]MBI5114688.1 flagellar basal-body rod protein FlgG [Rhodovulum sp.]MTW15519.1 flagellar basal-body rod protein FlgG [Rhodoplanes serenus]RAI35173.1 flagellar basal-body rod protein FlgG [Rhodoplanes serenus]VCU09503.1 Flagellar basal-body rod protein FlgG [Rhodoplanes serenus]
MRALHTAATGMMAQELNVQVISNNIANMRTTGYKRQRAEFQDLLYEHVRRIGTQTSDQGNILPVGVDIGSGVKTVGTPRIMTQGTILPTGRDLDVAIRGEGFFKIQMPDGSYAYTRDGSFEKDGQGRIVTAQGNLVQPGITIPTNATSVTINSQGQVSVTIPGNTTPQVLGQLTLTRFINKAGLQPIGDNLFVETPASGAPQDGLATVDGLGDLQQLSLEQANVEAVTEISDLIAAQRAYEMNAKVISATDSMLQASTSMLRS